MKTPPDLSRRIWRVPLLLALATFFGLFAALLGTGIWHVLAWAALAWPLLMLIRKMNVAFFPKTK